MSDYIANANFDLQFNLDDITEDEILAINEVEDREAQNQEKSEDNEMAAAGDRDRFDDLTEAELSALEGQRTEKGQHM